MSRGWIRSVRGWWRVAPGADSTASSGGLQSVWAYRAEVQTPCSKSESCAPFDRFYAHPGWTRRCKTSPRPRSVSARCWISGLSWSPPETSWSAAWGCGLTSPRGGAGAGSFWKGRVTPAPPGTCSAWRPAPLSCSRRLDHNVNAASVCALSSWGTGRVLGVSVRPEEAAWASALALVVGRGHSLLCWPRSVGRLWEPLRVNPPGPLVLWQAPGWDRKPGSLWEPLF